MTTHTQKNLTAADKSRPVLVIGAARSGLAAAKLLAREGWKVVLTDMNTLAQADKAMLENLGIEVFDGGHPEQLKQTDWAFVVKNPGIPYKVPFIQHFVQNQTPIYTEIETAFQAAPDYHYGAITGTDGKTTTVTLLLEMLKKKSEKARAAGNIGIPLSEVVLEDDGEKDIALELSNFQLLGIDTFRPSVSAVTNLAPDHLDYMNSLDDYYRSKFRIYENCTPEDAFILNEDDPLIVQYAKDIPCEVITMSLTNPDARLRRQNGSVYLDDVRLFDEKDLKLVGEFNLANAMMAAGEAYRLGVSPEDIEQVISSFPGVEHRIEYVGSVDGIRVYNDSKATNTHSAMAALSGFPGGVRLLCGGKNKGIDYSVLSQYDGRVDKCYSFGEIKDVFGSIFTRQQSYETMEQALDAALADAKASGKDGEVILLCPATSSFDQFKNYEVRGEIFKELAHERGVKL